MANDYVDESVLPFDTDLINDCFMGLILVFYYFQSIDVNAKMVENFGSPSINKYFHFSKMIDWHRVCLWDLTNGSWDQFM